MNKIFLLLALFFITIMTTSNAADCNMHMVRRCWDKTYKGINICAYATDGNTCCGRWYPFDFHGQCVPPSMVNLGICDTAPIPQPLQCPRYKQICSPYGKSNCTQATDGATQCIKYPGYTSDIPPTAMCLEPSQ